MLGLLYPFSSLNNENNIFIPTNIGYFTRCRCMPNIPLSAYDERLSSGRVTNIDFSDILSKISRVCNDFQALFICWIIEWILKLFLFSIILKVIIDISMKNDLHSYYYDIYVIFGIIIIESIIFFICKKIINNYEHSIEIILNEENEKKYESKNLYWRILPECRYLHLILNYENYINPKVKIVTDHIQMMYSLNNLKT